MVKVVSCISFNDVEYFFCKWRGAGCLSILGKDCIVFVQNSKLVSRRNIKSSLDLIRDDFLASLANLESGLNIFSVIICESPSINFFFIDEFIFTVCYLPPDLL